MVLTSQLSFGEKIDGKGDQGIHNLSNFTCHITVFLDLDNCVVGVVLSCVLSLLVDMLKCSLDFNLML